MKWVALGVVGHPGSYFRDPWNYLDATVVAGSFADFALAVRFFLSVCSRSGGRILFATAAHGCWQGSGVSAVRILRVLRVLRPLRAIKRAEGLRHVVQCMIVTIKTIGNVFVMTLVLQFMFAVVGTQAWARRFSYCTDPAIKTAAACTGTFLDYPAQDLGAPVVAAREWRTWEFNYNNVGEAMLSLFTVSTAEGWMDLMYHSSDTAGQDEGPDPFAHAGVRAKGVLEMMTRGPRR